MNRDPHADAFDPDRILSVLDEHAVDYVLVGGVAARVHGASRATTDIDCVPSIDEPNLERLAAALLDLGARLRVAGMSDEESRRLPLHLDARTLAAFGSSTWMTDAGPLDLLVELRDAQGGRHPFEDLVQRSMTIAVGAVSARWLRLRTSSPPSSSLPARKTWKPCQNCRQSSGRARRRW